MTYLPQSKIKEFREQNKPLCCPILASKKDDWVLDHDHQTGMVRGVISRQANSLLGKVENFYLRMCKGDKEHLPGVLRWLLTSNKKHWMSFTQLDLYNLRKNLKIH